MDNNSPLLEMLKKGKLPTVEVSLSQNSLLQVFGGLALAGICLILANRIAQRF